MGAARHLLAIALASLPFAALADAAAGKATYEKTCALCHAGGLAGAPRFGQAAEWAPRIKTGVASLYESALKGTPRGMPGKGGNVNLPDADVKSAVDYMVAAAGGAKPAAAPAKPPAKPEAKPQSKEAAAPPVEVKAAPVEAKAAPVEVKTATAPSDPNAFNRLMAAPGRRNAPPPEDGIHDPANAGTHALQAPLAAFNGMPPLNAGNRVNWVGSLAEQKIKPRWDRNDPAAAAMVMDLNIVREVKGSMPDVVYPHKQHTEWLDCSACHPAIFIPQKGANQISMAAIMLGQKCGVCHGKVAFPVSECRLCHSRNKESTRTAAKETP